MAVGLVAEFDDKNFQAGVSRYVSSLGRVESSTQRTAGVMTALGHTISTALGTAIGVLAAQALPKLEQAVLAPINATRAWGGQLDELSDIFGLTDTNATAFAVALNKVGVSVQDGMSGFTYFTRQIASTKDQLADAGTSFSRTAADIAASHADALNQIARNWAKAQAEAGEQVNAVWADFNEKRGEIEENLQETLNGIWTDAKERRAQIEEDLAETALGIQKDLASRTQDIQEGLAERLLSIQEGLQDRLTSLAEQRTDLYRDTAKSIEQVEKNLAKQLSRAKTPEEEAALRQEAEERKREIEAEAIERERAIAKQEQREQEQAEKQQRLAQETAEKQMAAAREAAAEQMANAEKVAAKQIEANEKAARKQAEAAEHAAAKQIEAAEKAAQKQVEAIEKALAKQAQLVKEQQAEADKQAAQALAKAKQALGDVQTKSPFAQALKALGLTFKQVSDESRPFTDRLGDIMEAFAKLPEGVDASGVALQLFGKGGLEWLDFLRQGRKGLEDAKKLGIDLGLVLDPDKIKEFNRGLDLMNLGWDAIGINIGKTILPYATDLVAKFNEFLTTQAVPDLSKFLERMAAALKEGGLEGLGTEFWKALTEPKGIFEQLGAFVQSIRDWFEKGEGKTILTGIGSAFSAIVDGFTAWANDPKGGQSAIQAAMQTLGDAAMAALTLILGTAEKVAQAMNALTASMLKWVNDPAGGGKAIADLTGAFGNAVTNSLTASFSKDEAGNVAISSLISSLFWAVNGAVENLAKIGGNVAATIIGGLVKALVGPDLAKAIQNAVSAALGNAIMAICMPGMYIANLGANIANALFTGFTQGWDKLFSSWAAKISNVWNGTSAPGGTVPKFQEGGWVKRTGPAIVHAGEYVLNASQARIMQPVLTSPDYSRTYNVAPVHNWYGNASSIDRREIESLVSRVTYQSIKEIVGTG